MGAIALMNSHSVAGRYCLDPFSHVIGGLPPFILAQHSANDRHCLEPFWHVTGAFLLVPWLLVIGDARLDARGSAIARVPLATPCPVVVTSVIPSWGWLDAIIVPSV